MADRLHLPISNKKVEDVLMWRDVRVSGGIFAGLTLAYLVLEWSGYSFFCLAAYALFTLLSGLLIWHYAAPFVKLNPPIPSFVNDGITEEEAKKAMEKAVPLVNKTLALLNNVITGKDLVLSVKVLGAVYIAARVSAMMSLFTLAYLGVLVAFVAPKVYEMRKDQIDGYIGIAKDKVKEYYKQMEGAMKKIPSARRPAPPKKVE